MLNESTELSKLRLYALRATDKAEYAYCNAAYKRKGGTRKLAFVPLRKGMLTYRIIKRFSNNKFQATYYRNQISNEFIEDCASLHSLGIAIDDIATALEKNYGFVKLSTVKYAMLLA